MTHGRKEMQHGLELKQIDYAMADTWRKLFDEWQIDYSNTPGTTYTGAFIDGQLVGVGVHKFFGKTCRLKVLAVLPKYQRRGIGTALWQFRQGIIEQQMKDNAQVTYYSAYLTPDSLHMYKKMGFEIVSKRTKQFRNQEWTIYYARKHR